MPTGELSRDQVRQILVGLMDGSIQPAAAARWAGQWLLVDDHAVADRQIWWALDVLAGADIEDSPGELLHTPEDFQQWLHDFDRSDAERRRPW